MKRTRLKDDRDSPRNAWTKIDLRRSADISAVPLQISPALLKRRRLRRIGTALALTLAYLVIRHLGWLGSSRDLFFASSSDADRSSMAESRGWLGEKWFTDFRTNRTQQHDYERHSNDDDDDALLFGDRQGSSVLTRGSLQGPAERATSAAINVDHLHNWIRFASSFEAYDATDRISFAQMAFHTSTYARMLRHISEVPESLVQQFEEKLWYFVPGLEQLRMAHYHVAGQTQWITTETEDVVPIRKARGTAGQKLRRIAGRLGSRLYRRHDTPANNAHDEDATFANAAGDVAAEHSTRGIVIVTGDEHFPFAAQLIATIRDAHHCDIPIEVFYNDDEDLSEENQAYLENTFADVHTVSLAESQLYTDEFSQLNGSTYSMRSFALLATNFTEAMLLDADTVLTIDPHDFFTERGYSKMGTLFFRDILALDMVNADAQEFVIEQLGQRAPSEQLKRSAFWRRSLAHHQGAGVVVVNKANPNVFAALVFAVWQNSAWVREQVTYKTFFGDKETYWLAFELADLPYHFSTHEAGAIGAEPLNKTAGFCAEHQIYLLDTQVAHTHTPVDGHEHHVSTSEKRELQKRRVAWWNGSLMKNRGEGVESGELDASSTVWALDGRWLWANETMCLHNYTARNVEELGIKPSFEVLIDIGGGALQHLPE